MQASATLSALRAIQFHDSILESLHFVVDRRRLIVTLSCEERGEEKRFELTFSDVSNVIQDVENPFEIQEISSAGFSALGADFKANFVFLLGFGRPTCSLIFEYRSVSINRR